MRKLKGNLALKVESEFPSQIKQVGREGCRDWLFLGKGYEEMEV